MHFARVHVHVIALVVDVVCLMLVLSARVVVQAVVIAFPQPVFCSRRYTLHTIRPTVPQNQGTKIVVRCDIDQPIEQRSHVRSNRPTADTTSTQNSSLVVCAVN